MGKVTMVECDNPKCKSTDHPESINSRGVITAGPYGWFDMQVWCVGRSNQIRVFACQPACVGPAVEHKITENIKQ